MSWYDQGQHPVRLEWGLAGARHLTGTTYAVVVDTLSFSTTVTKALECGLVVLPYPHHADGAEAYAAEHQATLALVREEAVKRGAPSLSPTSVESLEAGTRVVLPSENGATIAYELRDKGAIVLAGCLRNRAVLGGWLAQRLEADPEASVLLICAGEQWEDGSLRPCFEDHLAAGAIVAALQNYGIKASAEAYAASAVFRDAAPYMPGTVHETASARGLTERGYSGDVDIAAELDVSQIIPVLEDTEFVAAS